MVDFFKQAIAADSKGVISSLVMSVMVAISWGDNNIANTMKQLVAWMHPDHFQLSGPGLGITTT
jgi:hypothetical protein